LAALGKDGNPISIGVLAEQEDISPVFLEQIFFRLRRAGIVDSVRGPGGGFLFAKPLGSLTVKAVLDAAGEDLDITACDRHTTRCTRLSECQSHAVWKDLTDIVHDYFAGITLASLIEDTDEKPAPKSKSRTKGKTARAR
jgi:Rrf2 family iron-sulfur cluster assembly transcriptional regulator